MTNAAGYDFYRNIPEFTSFMKSQADALSLAENEIVADMGCGTGIFVEQLLELAAQQFGRVSIKEITAVDLVQAALDKTRVKCNAVLMADPELSTISLRYLQRNLEPNRLIPVKRFVDITDLPLEFLRTRFPASPASPWTVSSTIPPLTFCGAWPRIAFAGGAVVTAADVL